MGAGIGGRLSMENKLSPMSVTDAAIHDAKPASKPYKKADGGGLYIEVWPNGAKYWRLKYRFAGKEKRLSFGVYPGATLAEARQRREEARTLLANGVDPGEIREKERAVIQKAGLAIHLVILPNGMREIRRGHKLHTRLRQWQLWAKSTGARTPAGKAIASLNAYKDGVSALLREMSALLSVQRDGLKRI